MIPPSLKRHATEEKDISPPPTKRVARVNTPDTNSSITSITKSPSKITSSTTSKAVANFFKPITEKAPELCKWTSVNDSLLICKYQKEDDHKEVRPRKVAAFDFDSTLVVSNSGKKFTKEAHDWKWWHASVENNLRGLVEQGYLVRIISNQAGLSLDPQSKTSRQDQQRVNVFKQKVKAVLNVLDLPITLYAATQHDLYRKPRTGMWEQLLIDAGQSVPSDLDLAGSFFVGDAGGRFPDHVGGKDFSCSDRNMAANIGLTFKTPEEYFLAQTPRPFNRGFDPKVYSTGLQSDNISSTLYRRINKQDIVLFVGSPGAGKSTFFWTQLKPLSYERVNQDILKSRDACLSAATNYLEEGLSVTVDNTNADIDVRAHWIKLAKQFNVPIRCVLFTAPAMLCEHNNVVRALGGSEVNPENRTLLPKMAFTGFANRYREPSLKEGFQDITKVDFEFIGSEEQREMWSRYWVS